MPEQTQNPNPIQQSTYPQSVQPVQVKKEGMGTGMKIFVGCGVLTVIGVLCAVAFFVYSTIKFDEMADKAKADLDATMSAASASAEAVQSANTQYEENVFNNPQKIGDVITVGNVDWSVTEVKNLGTKINNELDSFLPSCNASSGKFVQVKLKAKNTSNQVITTNATYQNVYDSAKNQYIKSDVLNCMLSNKYTSSVNPGIEYTFKLIFEIPTSSTGLRMKIGAQTGNTRDYKYVSLGF